MSDPILRKMVLEVLRGQSPFYYIFPNASAFVAAGLINAEDVAEVLTELYNEGLLEREHLFIEVTGGVDDGATEKVDGGYRLINDPGEEGAK